MTLDISFTGSYIYMCICIYMYKGVNPGLYQEEGNGKPPPCALPGKRLWLTSRLSPGVNYDLMQLSIYIYIPLYLCICASCLSIQVALCVHLHFELKFKLSCIHIWSQVTDSNINPIATELAFISYLGLFWILLIIWICTKFPNYTEFKYAGK